MNAFERMMETIATGYLEGAFRGTPADVEDRDKLRAALRDAFCTGFKAGFSLARKAPSIPTPKTAIYKPKEKV